MGDDRHHCLRLRAIYTSRRRARLQVLDGLEAIGEGEPEVGDLGFRGLRGARRTPSPRDVAASLQAGYWCALRWDLRSRGVPTAIRGQYSGG
jgi:hypothetical protein